MGRLLALTASVAALAGCDVVFGSRYEPPRDAAELRDSGTALHEVRGALVRRYVYDSQSGPTLTLQPHTAEELPQVVAWDGDLERPVTWNHDDGTFTFEASLETPWRLVLTTNNFESQIQSRRATVRLAGNVYDRPLATMPITQPVISGTKQDFATATYLQSTGVWNIDVLIEPTNQGANYTVAWPAGKRLLDTSMGDRLFAVTYGQDTNYRRILRVDGPLSLQLQEGANVLDLDAELAPANHCTQLRSPTPAIADQLAAAFPEWTLVSSGWGIYAQPVSQLGPYLLFPLADTIGTDDVSVAYADPYGFDHLALAQSVRRRDVATGGNNMMTLTVATRSITAVDDACPGGLTTIPADNLVIPHTPILEGVLLSADTTIVTVGGVRRQLELSWIAPNAETHAVALYDVTDLTDATQLSGRLVYYYRTTEPRVAMDTALFDPEKWYVAVIASERGFRDAATGDFTMVGYPYSYGQSVTGSFRLAE